MNMKKRLGPDKSLLKKRENKKRKGSKAKWGPRDHPANNPPTAFQHPPRSARWVPTALGYSNNPRFRVLNRCWTIHSATSNTLSLRSLLRDKGFAATAVLTLLAVCIAANTTTFAVVNSVLLRPLPVADSQSIILMSNQYPKAGVSNSRNSGSGDYYDRLAGVSALQEQALFRTTMETMDLNGGAEQVHGMVATPSLFGLLHVTPQIGRTFTEQEGEIGKEQKVILSHQLWDRLFKGDPNAVGRQVRLNGRVFDIIGVMPADFDFVDPEVRFWIPAAFTPQDKVVRHSNNWYHVGRLKPGATIAQVTSQVAAINAVNLDRYPEYKEAVINAGFHTTVEPLQHVLVKNVESSLYLLWGAAIFVLLLGTLNIANLVLARLTVRRKEIAIRLALGVSRGRLSGTTGPRKRAAFRPRRHRRNPSRRGLLQDPGGLRSRPLPARHRGPSRCHRRSRRPRSGHRRRRRHRPNAACQCLPSESDQLAAGWQPHRHHRYQDPPPSPGSRRGGDRLCFSFITAAGLLLTSFRNLLAVDPGFNTANVLTSSFSAPAREI